MLQYVLKPKYKMDDVVCSVLNPELLFTVTGYMIYEVDNYDNVLYYEIRCTNAIGESFYYREKEIYKVEVIK